MDLSSLEIVLVSLVIVLLVAVLVRERTGMGLKEAKDLVERF